MINKKQSLLGLCMDCHTSHMSYNHKVIFETTKLEPGGLEILHGKSSLEVYDT